MRRDTRSGKAYVCIPLAFSVCRCALFLHHRSAPRCVRTCLLHQKQNLPPLRRTAANGDDISRKQLHDVSRAARHVPHVLRSRASLNFLLKSGSCTWSASAAAATGILPPRSCALSTARTTAKSITTKCNTQQHDVTCSRSSSDTCNGGTCSCSTLPSSIVHVMLTTLTPCLHLRVRGRFSKLYCEIT